MLTLILVVSMVAPGAANDAPAELAVIAPVTLVDQHGAEGDLARHRGRVVVAMVVTAKRLRNIRPWERDLREHFGDRLVYLRITDVPEDSPATLEKISGKLAERVPDGVSVLIDIDRVWASGLHLDTARPNILVINSGGELVASYRGRHEAALAAKVIDDLKGLLDR